MRSTLMWLSLAVLVVSSATGYKLADPYEGRYEEQREFEEQADRKEPEPYEEEEDLEDRYQRAQLDNVDQREAEETDIELFGSHKERVQSLKCAPRKRDICTPKGYGCCGKNLYCKCPWIGKCRCKRINRG